MAVMLVLAASPKLAVLDFQLVQVSRPELSAFYAEHFAVKLAVHGVTASTQKDIETMLGLERQRALLGCSDSDSSCAVELAGALGVEGLVVGHVAHVGSRYQVNLRVLSAKSAAPLYVFSRLVGDEEQILSALEAAAGETAKALGAVAPPAVTAPVEARASSVVTWAPWAVVGAGAVATAVGAVYLVQANAEWSRLRAPASVDLPPASADALAKRGELDRTVGLVTASVGVAAIGAGLAWRFLGSDSGSESVAVAPVQGGALIVVGGAF